jgi:hypothetical protein
VSARRDWKRELRRTAACLPLERLGETLTRPEREHLESCARCQAEMALWQEFRDDEPAAGEELPVQWIASEVRRRRGGEGPRNVISTWRLLATAATLIIAVGAGYIAINREPSVDVPFRVANPYRSAQIEGLAPVGDLAAAPGQLQWSAVPGASKYDVRILEVDGTVLWEASTIDAHVLIPPDIVAKCVRGKTILWEVAANRGGVVVSQSGTQRFRVIARSQ